MPEVTTKNISTRNRKTQAAFRKKQLILATIDCIDKLGLSQTTLNKVAEQAGMSQGNVIFHFQTKEILLEKALLHMDTEYRDNWQKAVADSNGTPSSKLKALISSSFSSHICTRKKISVWYAFWGEVRSRPKYFEICGENDALFSNTMLAACQSIEKETATRLDAKTAAFSIEGAINGLWQNICSNRQGLIDLVSEAIGI